MSQAIKDVHGNFLLRFNMPQQDNELLKIQTHPGLYSMIIYSYEFQEFL